MIKMKNVVFIPVRGGSKSIPLKNIKLICGKPLVYWTVMAACECVYVDRVFVATDSEAIRETVQGFGFPKLEVISRSNETASDTASTESAMLEFAANYDFENICLVQATSPLLQAGDLNGGFALYESKGADSVLSVVRQKRFIWECDENGFAAPKNYDVFHRPRRQEFDGYLVENGAFYITSRELLFKSKNRVSGRIKPYEMEEKSYIEIDEPADWVTVEAIMRSRKQTMSAHGIKMFLTDCDGVLTDGGMYYSEHGDELKKFNTRDGVALSMLNDCGIITGIITGEATELVRKRAEKLKLTEVLLGIRDKVKAVEVLIQKYGVSFDEIAYIGDDINDIELLKRVGMSACPADAAESVKNCVDYIIPQRGGDGAVRKFVDFIFGERLY